ncbi:MAG: phosphoglycerate dehydrogenase [Chloroflexi bacterium]|nr:phosphoglycerate dehydrogenase [Chloroflexota bacterium]
MKTRTSTQALNTSKEKPATYRILVADPLAEEGLAILRQHGQVEVRTGLSDAELAQIIREYDALIVRSGTRVTREVLAAAHRLKVVARAGVGVDNIDIQAATDFGVLVVNAPTGNIVAAAEHTIALLMAMARRLPQAYVAMREGTWNRKAYMGMEVREKTLGLIGLGRVASEVARRARGLEMHVVAHDPYVSTEYARKLGVTLLPLEELLAQADIVSLHLPLTPETQRFIDHERLAQMKPGAYLINTSRGGVIDEEALLRALDEGHLAGAALDVFSVEPLPPDHPLRHHPKVILTPHIGGSTVEAQARVARDAAEQVIAALQGRPVPYAVNAPIVPPQSLAFLTPWIDLAERLGRFLRQMGGARLSRVELTVHGDLIQHDITYLRAAVLKGLLEGIVDERVNLVNAVQVARRRGIEFVERRREQGQRFHTMLTLRGYHADQGEETVWLVRGAIVYGEPTIVGVNDLWVEFPARGHLLLTRHHDQPGIIGKIGTLLGSRDINIAFMHVGRRAPRGEAIMVLGLDDPLPDDVLEELRRAPLTYWVRKVEL